MSENPHVALLFIDVCSPKRLRVNGTARELFPNCSRYLHQYQLVERSKFVPHCNVPTPVPAWKQSE